MPNAKWTPSLKKAAEKSAPDQALHVVLELSKQRPTTRPGASRADAILAGKQDFARLAQPIKDKIQQLGGELTGEAWINATLSATLPVSALDELADDDSVESIDLPRSLVPEG